MKRDIAPTPLDHMIAIVSRLRARGRARADGNALPVADARVAADAGSRGVLQPSLCLILQATSASTSAPTCSITGRANSSW